MSSGLPVFELEELFWPLSSWGPEGGERCWSLSLAARGPSDGNRPQAGGRLPPAPQLPVVTKGDA